MPRNPVSKKSDVSPLRREQVEAYYAELSALATDARPPRLKYEVLYGRFVELLHAGTAGSALVFGGPFARLQHLCLEAGVPRAVGARLNHFRVRCRRLAERSDAELAAHFLSDLRLVAEFVAAVWAVPVPNVLAAQLPLALPPDEPMARHTGGYFRASVLEAPAGGRVLVAPADGSAERLELDLTGGPAWQDRRYLLPLLQQGVQVNVVRAERLDDGALRPELLILESDYLVDVSTLAACFEPYGATPLSALLAKLRPAPRSAAILLGNFAGNLLDEVIHADGGSPAPSYAQSVGRFFRHNALQFAACPGLTQAFHAEARTQRANLQQIIAHQFKADPRIDMDSLVLEPSFFCEELGLQGRMDVLQLDYRVLMEQKSGKRAFGTNGHVEKHYVQMLLYLAVLHYGFGMSHSEVSPYLLYSKYPDGLLRETPAPELLFRALSLRNRLVAAAYSLSRGGAGRLLQSLTPEDFNPRGQGGRLWRDYTRPAIENFLRPFHSAPPEALAYFDRMFTFVQREQILAKVGSNRREAGGLAALWSLSLAEKRAAGQIYDHLTLLSLRPAEADDGSGIGYVELAIPADQGDGLPNFRRGDIVVFYRYALSREPDVRHTPVLRGTICRLTADRLVIGLRAPQRNKRVFATRADEAWAVEHDFMDSSYRGLFRGLYALLTATPRRRDLLLARREPEVDWKRDLVGDYARGGSTELNDLVRRAKRAKDFFLLIGPPGTGKTSLGLMSITTEALASGCRGVLLAAFTNRAVDEICSKLTRAHLDFVRVGSPMACDEAYRPQLLQERLKSCPTLTAAQQLIASARLVVGTVASLTAGCDLFALRRFEVAIIDEASQLLEPQLLPLLCAKHNGADAIAKFVLIGDHKQLPAVAAQSEEEAAVHQPALLSMGLTNCRHSLFERLVGLTRHSAFFQFSFTRQGRMHPAVAAFAARAFYGGRLSAIGTPHQRVSGPWLSAPVGASPLERLLAAERMVFVDCPLPPRTVPDKVNPPEAHALAAIAAAVHHLIVASGRPFKAESSLGVIVPYRGQVACVRRALAATGIAALADVTVDTVERYQGSERDVVLYGFTVRRRHGLDFLTDSTFVEEGRTIDRKLNVALTRAREQTILVGHAALLGQNPLFHRLMAHCKAHGAFWEYNEAAAKGQTEV